MPELKDTEISTANGNWQEAEEVLRLIRELEQTDGSKEKLLELLRENKFAEDLSGKKTKTA